jgi:class 3 adenylate cyclase
MAKRFWFKIINIGIHSDVPILKAKYIQATNGIAFITPITVLSFVPNLIYFLPSTKTLLINLCCSIFMYSFVLILNLFRKYSIAKVYMLFSAVLNVVIASALLGHELNFHLYLLAVITVSYLIFDSEEKPYQIISVCFTTLSFVSIVIWNQFYNRLIVLPHDFIPLSRFNNEIGLLLLISGLNFVILINYRKSESQLEEEKKKSENLLYNILPISIAKQLREKDGVIAEGFSETTILFADIVGFTMLSERLEPAKVVNLLNEIFSIFDQLIEKSQLEKIKTIGDAYMVVSGVPQPNNNHASTVADLALEMRDSMKKWNQENQQSLELRIGINSGHIVAGVIGLKKFVYDVWGDAVNTASRMESHGIPGQIQVSNSTYEYLKDQYVFEDRGKIEIKGKGKMQTYLLIGKRKK